MQTIHLGDGIVVDLAFRGSRYDGIAGARRDGRTFLVPGRGSLPWCRTPDGIVYDEFHLAGEQRDGAARILRFTAIGRCAPVAADSDMFGFPLIVANRSGSTVEDELEMRLAPASATVDGEDWRGFTVAYTWRSRERRIHWLYESVALAPDGDAVGARVMAQNMTQFLCPLESVLAADTAWSTQEHYDRSCIDSPCRGAGTQIFDLVQGDGLAVATWFAEPPLHGDAIRGSLQHATGERFATSSDLHYAALSDEFATSPRTVLAAPRSSATREDAIDRWSAWRAHSAAVWRAAIGLPHSIAEPMLTFEGTGAGGIDPGQAYPTLLTDWAQRLDWVAAQGFRIVNLHTPEWVSAANRRTAVFGGNNCCPFSFTLSDQLGGEAGLKTFCDACHARGLKVMIWICGHLHREAPIWREHPEWRARSVDGRLWDGHYGVIHSLDLANPEARRWMADDLIRLRRATGVDALWCDSFAGLFMGVVNHASPDRAPAAAGTLLLLRELAAAGYAITIEGMSQLGVSSWGNLRPAAIAGMQELLVDTSFRYFVRDWHTDPAINRDSYHRSLAARAPFAVWGEEFLGHAEAFPLPLPEWHGPLSRAYNCVSARMHRRRLLPEGALWYDAAGRPAAWFAFADGCRDPEVVRTRWSVLAGAGAGAICAADS